MNESSKAPRGALPRSSAPRHAPRAARTPFLLVLLGLVVGGLCTLLALNTASAANELQRHQFATADESVANDVAALQNAVAASAAPGNVARAAQRLGMVPAGNPAFLVVKPDGSVVLMGSPAAASDTYVPPPPPTTPKSTPHSTAHSSSSPQASSHSTPNRTPASSAHSTSQPPAHSSPHTSPHSSTHTSTHTSTHASTHVSTSRSTGGNR